MGVWERSPAGIAIANRNASLMDDFHRALPDFRPEDNVGSAYCVRRYVVDKHLGGPEGLAIARRELAKRGMKLLLDFVPNHMAPDSPWIARASRALHAARRRPSSERTGLLRSGGREDLRLRKGSIFPAWLDVVQVNAFEPSFPPAIIELLLDVAGPV